MQFAIQKAKKIRADRENRTAVDDVDPAIASSPTVTAVKESEKENPKDGVEINVSTSNNEEKLSVFQSYNSLLKNHPFVVNSIQSAGMFVFHIKLF